MLDYVVKGWDALDEEMGPGINKCLSLIAGWQGAAGGSAVGEEGGGVRGQMRLRCIRWQPINELTISVKHGIRPGETPDAALLLHGRDIA